MIIGKQSDWCSASPFVQYPLGAELALALASWGLWGASAKLSRRLSRLPLLNQDNLAPSWSGWRYKTPPTGRCRLRGSEEGAHQLVEAERTRFFSASDGRSGVCEKATSRSVSLTRSSRLGSRAKTLNAMVGVMMRLVADTAQVDQEPLTCRTTFRAADDWNMKSFNDRSIAEGSTVSRSSAGRFCHDRRLLALIG